MTEMAFIDSYKLQVCHNLRILRHKVVQGTSKQGKETRGWFYDLKLHLIINDQGGIISAKVTTANKDYRKPVLEMADELCEYFEIKIISLIHCDGNLQTRE
uniref:transposase n=1 Tax=Candidatus Enterovibrio escicola TaxID=1927127 RepID=UPI0021E047D5|nr:transposase [Candidatus Enterovibrio escacola]